MSANLKLPNQPTFHFSTSNSIDGVKWVVVEIFNGTHVYPIIVSTLKLENKETAVLEQRNKYERMFCFCDEQKKTFEGEKR